MSICLFFLLTYQLFGLLSALLTTLIYTIIAFSSCPTYIFLTASWLLILMYLALWKLSFLRKDSYYFFIAGFTLSCFTLFNLSGYLIYLISIIWLISPLKQGFIQKGFLYTLGFSCALIPYQLTLYRHTHRLFPIIQTGPWLSYYIAPSLVTKASSLDFKTAQTYLIQAGHQAVHARIASLKKTNFTIKAWYEWELIFPALSWIKQYPGNALAYWFKNVLANSITPYQTTTPWLMYHIFYLISLISFLILCLFYSVPGLFSIQVYSMLLY